jgi:protocatechuate 3,4-dioxygenase beta subunit
MHCQRRGFLSALFGASFAVTEATHGATLLTPRQATGPFYPSALPRLRDNDLVDVDGSGHLASGQITHLSGRVIDTSDNPIQTAHVEIWQCDAFGRYHHENDFRQQPLDPYFQGFGRTTTDSDGRYSFRTIKPVAYPARAPHIHFKVSGANLSTLVTQLYVDGEPSNSADILLRSTNNAVLLTARFEHDPQPPGELRTTFNLVVETH